MHLDCAPSGSGSHGSGHSEHLELEKASVDASVQPTYEAKSAAIGAGHTTEGMLHSSSTSVERLAEPALTSGQPAVHVGPVGPAAAAPQVPPRTCLRGRRRRRLP